MAIRNALQLSRFWLESLAKAFRLEPDSTFIQSRSSVMPLRVACSSHSKAYKPKDTWMSFGIAAMRPAEMYEYPVLCSSLVFCSKLQIWLFGACLQSMDHICT